MKACPYCAEQIQDAAVVCRFCNRDVPAIEPPKVSPEELARRRKAFRRFLGVVGVMATVGFIVKIATEPTSSRGAAGDAAPAAAAPSKPPSAIVFTASFESGQVVVSNLNEEDWTDVKFDLNGGTFSDGFVYRLDRLGSMKSVKVGTLLFANSDGVRFNPFQMKPQKLQIEARIGGAFDVKTVRFE